MLGTPRDELLPIDYDALITETDEAWFVEIDGRQLWLPKSQCDIDENGSTIQIPAWLCEEEDLSP